MSSSYSKQLLGNTLGLFGVWLVLSGRYDLFHVMTGLLVAGGVAWLNTGFAHSAWHGFPWLRAVFYIPWLFLRVVQSSLHLTKLILGRSLPIKYRLISYRSQLKHQGAIVVLGNSVTLTPGTITVEVNGSHLLVHAIDEAAGEDLTSGRMEKKIAEMFQEKGKHG